jgi:deazaflavin-dependent oxidoreductase (nitroreductase family)
MTHNTIARLESRLFRIAVERFGLDIDHTWILEVPGRRTGVPRFTPLKVLEVDKEHYLVALHHDSDWPRNLRAAAGSARLRHRRRVIAVDALELPSQERTRILRGYLAAATRGRTLDILGAGRRDPEEGHLRRIAADHPVFRIAVADGSSRRTGPAGLSGTAPWAWAR